MFAHMTETQLRHGQSGDGNGLFIVESPKVIAVALAHGYRPEALLCEQRHIHGDAAEIIAALPQDTPVYTGDRNTLAALTGYTLTRGVLCAMRRPAPRSDVEVCRDALRVAVIDGVCDTTNTGAIFRSAAALGMDADDYTAVVRPLQSSLRARLWAVYSSVPWAYIQGNDTIARLHQLGLDTAALCASRQRHRFSTTDDSHNDNVWLLLWALKAKGSTPESSMPPISPCAYPCTAVPTRSTSPLPQPSPSGNCAIATSVTAKAALAFISPTYRLYTMPATPMHPRASPTSTPQTTLTQANEPTIFHSHVHSHRHRRNRCHSCHGVRIGAHPDLWGSTVQILTGHTPDKDTWGHIMTRDCRQ